MTLLEACLLYIAACVSVVAFVHTFKHRHQVRLPPPERPLDLTGWRR